MSPISSALAKKKPNDNGARSPLLASPPMPARVLGKRKRSDEVTVLEPLLAQIPAHWILTVDIVLGPLNDKCELKWFWSYGLLENQRVRPATDAEVTAQLWSDPPNEEEVKQVQFRAARHTNLFSVPLSSSREDALPNESIVSSEEMAVQAALAASFRSNRN